MTYFPEFYCANMGNSVIVYFSNIFQPVEWSRCAPWNRSGSPLSFGHDWLYELMHVKSANS